MILMSIVPIILTIVPVMAYQAVLRFCGKKSTCVHYLWTYIMMIYIRLVFYVTGIGSVWDIISKGGLAAAFQQANMSFVPFQSEGLFTYCMNVIMFMPLGFLLPYIWRNFRNPLKTALTGFFFSAFIELAQLPTHRLADIDDLMMNTLGAILGYGVWKIIGSYLFGKREDQRTVSLGKLEPIVYLISACACIFFLYDWRWFI